MPSRNGQWSALLALFSFSQSSVLRLEPWVLGCLEGDRGEAKRLYCLVPLRAVEAA